MVDRELKTNCKCIVCVDQACGEVTSECQYTSYIYILLWTCFFLAVTVPNPKATREPKKIFTFDNVFGADSSQAELYNETARRIVDAVLQGYNGRS